MPAMQTSPSILKRLWVKSSLLDFICEIYFCRQNASVGGFLAGACVYVLVVRKKLFGWKLEIENGGSFTSSPLPASARLSIHYRLIFGCGAFARALACWTCTWGFLVSLLDLFWLFLLPRHVWDNIGLQRTTWTARTLDSVFGVGFIAVTF